MIATRAIALATSLSAVLLLCAAPARAQSTHIYEFQHAPIVLHYHPVGGHQFVLADVDEALAQEVHALELDLHYRSSDDQVVTLRPDTDSSRSIHALNRSGLSVSKARSGRHVGHTHVSGSTRAASAL